MDDKQNQTAVVIAERLSSLRAAKGVTQEALADAVGVSNKTVSKWETAALLPEAEYMPAIADYYAVSIDYLYGRDYGGNIDRAIQKHLNGFVGSDAITEAYRLTLNLIDGCRCADRNKIKESGQPIPKNIVAPNDDFTKSLLSSWYCFFEMINSKDVNAAVMLLGNESNFSWMPDTDRYIAVLKLLADENALKLLYVLLNEDFPTDWTADYAAKKADIAMESAQNLLDSMVNFEFLSKQTAMLTDGNVTVYSYGCGHCNWQGNLLTAISLAYESICGSDNYWNAYHGQAKLIRAGDVNMITKTDAGCECSKESDNGGAQ